MLGCNVDVGRRHELTRKSHAQTSLGKPTESHVCCNISMVTTTNGLLVADIVAKSLGCSKSSHAGLGRGFFFFFFKNPICKVKTKQLLAIRRCMCKQSKRVVLHELVLLWGLPCSQARTCARIIATM